MDKFFLKSKTILGLILSVLPALLPAFGVSFGESDVALVNSTVDALIQAFGAIMAVYGRFQAGGVKLTPIAK